MAIHLNSFIFSVRLEKQNSDSAVSRIGAQGFRASFRKFRTNSNNFSEGKDDKTDTGRKTTRKKSDDGAAGRYFFYVMNRLFSPSGGGG